MANHTVTIEYEYATTTDANGGWDEQLKAHRLTPPNGGDWELWKFAAATDGGDGLFDCIGIALWRRIKQPATPPGGDRDG